MEEKRAGEVGGGQWGIGERAHEIRVLGRAAHQSHTVVFFLQPSCFFYYFPVL